jgi:hypothetical protein
MDNKKETKGLIRLRKRTAKSPEYFCDNCNCKRYSPCTCKKSKK